MNGKDYYAILGIGRNATQKEIKQAYRRLARKHHPDVNPGDKDAENRFKEVQQAYDVLGNAEKRAQYDQFGQVGPFSQQAGAPGGPRGYKTYSWNTGGGQSGPRIDFGNLGDLFGSFMGGRQRTATRRPGEPQRRNITLPTELTLREAFAGTTRIVNLKVEEACPACKGRGATPDGVRTCGSCGGDGQSSGKSGFFDLSGVCESCGGAGEVIVSPCKECGGSGVVQKPRRLEIKVPAGVTDGQKIRAAGQGPGGGDVFLQVRIKPDPVFSRKGNDLWIDMPISFPEAALGTEIEVPTMTGRVKVKVPPETSSGQALRLTGQGFPGLSGNSRGDQFVRLKILVPKQLSDEEKDLIRKLSELRGDKSEGRTTA